jgi:cytidylate kinase
VVTSKLESVFHVRLVGALEKRIEYVRKVKELAEDAATTYVRKEDCGRRRYLRKYYGKDVDDPLLYHLVINTSLLSYEATARIVADAVLSVQGEQSDRAA